MKQTRAFPFETQAKNDETGKVRVELGLSNYEFIRFDTLVPFMPFRDMMIPLFQTLLLKEASVTLEKIPYRDWYANELIRRVRANSEVIEDKPDHMKVDLKQLLERRDALISRIAPQMKYYEDNKYMIDQMLQVRANHWKVYSGPHICKIDNLLIFEGLSEYNDLYWRVGWNTTPLREDEEAETVAAWVEMSYQFINDLEGQTPEGIQTELLLTTSKPRADIRVLRRGEDEATRTFDLPPKWLNSLRYIHSIEYLFSKEKLGFDPVKIRINQVELFDLVYRIYTNTKINTILDCTFTFLPGEERELQIRTDEHSILINLMFPGIDVSIIQVSLNSTFFHTVRPLLHHIKEAEFVLLPRGYPSYVTLYGPATITIAMNDAITAEQQRHQSIFLASVNYLLNKEDEALVGHCYDISQLNKAFYPYGDKIYPFGLQEFNTEEDLSDREVLIFLNSYMDQIVRSDRIRLELPFGTSLSLSRGEIIDSECDCGRNSINYPCIHVKALVVKAYWEGWTNE